MVVLELEAVEIDYCFSCNGIWLDAGELGQLLNDSPQEDALLKTIKPAITNERPYLCPICHHKMKKITVGDNQEVMIDQCKKNHGLWFDKGELHQVIALGSKNEHSPVLELLNRMFADNLNK